MKSQLPAPRSANFAELDDDAAQIGARTSAFDIRYIFAAVRANLVLIGVIVGIALAISLVATLLQMPRYTASSSIQINNQGRSILKNQDDDNSEEATNASDTDRFLKTQTDVLRSRGLAQRVALKLKLNGSARFFAAQAAKPPAAGTPENLVRDKVTAMLQRGLTVTLPRDSRIVSISYESTDPALSADIANAYASEFIQANLKRKFDSSAYARDFVSGQLNEAKQRLEESERALNTYARSAGLIRMRDPSAKEASAGSNSVTTSSLMQLNQAANEAKAKRITAEGRWKAINSAQPLAANEVVSNATIAALLGQKAQIEAAYEEERSRHMDDYPTVKSKKQQLVSVERQIQSEVNNIRSAVRGEYTAAADAERQLMAQVEQLKGEMLSEQDRNVQFGLLSREVDTNREVYDGLLQRFKELNASSGISISNVSIIDTAEVPIKPTSPNMTRNMVIGLIVGVALAAFAVFIKDQFDDSIRLPEDIEYKLGLTLLGVIPHANKSDPETELSDPKSAIAEAYNSLRGSLLYSTPEGLPHVLMVTSAQPSEGKTTTSYAMASSLARMGKSVLLIDADMRRPSLHRRIDSDNDKGLSTLLTTQDSVGSVILPSPVTNLSLVTSGPIPPSPTELLSGVRLEQILQEAAGMFDTVVIDCPPVLGLADAPTMAALADGVVFIVEADRGRHGSLKTALRRLRAVRPIILGGVLTKFDPLKSGNRYASYYGYEYYQYQYRYGEDLK
jgi:succinoglycan biosynthesis transport protein ExoP